MQLFNQIVSNTERARNLIRMIRATMPDRKNDHDKYDYYEMLGIIQDILDGNAEILNRHEEIMMTMGKFLKAATAR